MGPTATVAELTKEKIGDLYFRSLEDTLTRKNHVLLRLDGGGGIKTGTAPHEPTSPNDVRADFTSWYGGILALAQMIDPGTTLPQTQTMVDYVTKNFDRAKAAIAA
jgi:hypothetical protein